MVHTIFDTAYIPDSYVRLEPTYQHSLGESTTTHVPTNIGRCGLALPVGVCSSYLFHLLVPACLCLAVIGCRSVDVVTPVYVWYRLITINRGISHVAGLSPIPAMP